jgi:putative drug exporter of the RND superfamily
MFRSLGCFVHAHRRAVLFAWTALIVVGTVLGGGVMDRLVVGYSAGDRLESARVYERVEALVGNDGELAAIVDGAPVDDPGVAASVQAAVADVAAMEGVVAVIDHYGTGIAELAATDGQASLVVVAVAPDLGPTVEGALVEAISSRLRAIDVPDVAIGGPLVMFDQFVEAAEADLQRGHTVALPIALVAMIIIFGGIIAAGLPLLIALAAVTVTMAALFGITHVTDVSLDAVHVIAMLGLGLSIDYGLLIVSRFKEERGRGHEVAAAVEGTVATAGRTVAFSALTVAAALSGLLTLREPTFTSFGVAGIAVVLVAMAAALTMLPALLAVCARRIKPAAARVDDHGYFYRLSRLVQRRPLPIVLGIGTLLVLLAVPFLGARFEMTDARSLPRGSESRQVAIDLAERFPAHGADPVTVVADVDPGSPDAESYLVELTELPGVAGVTTRPGTPDDVMIVDIVPHGPGQDARAKAVLAAVRDLDPGFPTEAGGTVGFLVDFGDSLLDRLPIALGVIAGATFVLLFLMTGSVLVPIKAIIMNLLSLGASFGALVWIFQDGNLSGLLGFDPVGSVDLVMPVLIFVFAFGLSMDYEVFLLARVKEIYDETGDSDGAVALGLQRTGKVITSAALLMVVVFGGFAAGQVLSIKQLGVGLALAVIVDATIVRSLMVPATMKLLGERNWWAPAPLRRLHAHIGLREAHDPGSDSAPGPVGVVTAAGGEVTDDQRDTVAALEAV